MKKADKIRRKENGNKRKWPKISLLVPAYNEEAVIDNALKHLVKDVKYPNKEIVVGVDKSDDRTLEIAKKYAKKYSFVKVDYSPKRRGVIGAFNSMLKICTGEIIIKFDADRKFGNPKTCLYNIVRYFKNPRVGGIYYTGEIDWKKNSHPYVELEYWPEIIAERERSIITRAENFLTVLQVQYRRQFFPVKGKMKIPIDISCFRRGLVNNIDTSMVHDDVEFAYQVLKKGYIIEFADNVFNFCNFGSPTKVKPLLQQKIKGNVGWILCYKKYDLNFGKYAIGISTTFLKNFYKCRFKDIVALSYWLILYGFSWLISIPKRHQHPTKVWKRWKRK
ncbi:MAG: glycosyltransferase [Candidatus Aenigmarchaeota archaeon]|nr:glycosyltransferase [Candidatus Aenigmarchaeota archaeon]